MRTVSELKKICKENKIKYAELAELSGIPLGTIKNIFAMGDDVHPRLDTMQSLEEALGLSHDKSLADTIIEHIDELNIEDYSSLSEEERRKIAEVFNITVSAFKKK